MFGDDVGNVYRGIGDQAAFKMGLIFRTGSSPISVIIGDVSRILFGTSNKIYEYSVLTDWQPFRVKTVGTPVGNFVTASQCYSTGDIFNGFNGAVFMTDNGELYKVRPCTHDICKS